MCIESQIQHIMESQNEVSFVVTKIEEPRKYGSVLEIGGEYVGIKDGRSIFWTDPGSDQQWIFYNNDTCQVI